MSSNYCAKTKPNIQFELKPTRPQIHQVPPLHYFVKTSGGQNEVEPDKEYDDFIEYDPYEAQREDEVKFENSDAWQSVMNIEQVTASGSTATHWNSTLNAANNTIYNSNNNNEIINNYNNNLINDNTATSAGNHFVEGVIQEDRDMFECLHLLVDTAVAVASSGANNNINHNNNNNEIINTYNNNLITNNTATSAPQFNHPENHFVDGAIQEDRDMFQCLHLLVDTAVAVRQREREQQEKEEKRNDENVFVLGD